MNRKLPRRSMLFITQSSLAFMTKINLLTPTTEQQMTAVWQSSASFSGTLAPGKRAQQSAMGKKICLSMDPKNVCSKKIVRTENVRTYVHPFM